MTTLVDGNILLDVFNPISAWHAWSRSAMTDALDAGRVAINAVVYAEASIRFSMQEDFEAAIEDVRIEREVIPYEAAFLAGKAFMAYRRRGGPRTTMLPDFLIGAHAAVRGYTLLTRDATRYRTYFPRLKIVAP
jgi:predicted nucleic acid-binding protein